MNSLLPQSSGQSLKVASDAFDHCRRAVYRGYDEHVIPHARAAPRPPVTLEVGLQFPGRVGGR